MLCHLAPTVSKSGVQFQNFLVLLLGPLLFVHRWRKVIVPTFSALLSDSTRQELGDLGPVTGPENAHLLLKNSVFLFCPGAL